MADLLKVAQSGAGTHGVRRRAYRSLFTSALASCLASACGDSPTNADPKVDAGRADGGSRDAGRQDAEEPAQPCSLARVTRYAGADGLSDARLLAELPGHADLLRHTGSDSWLRLSTGAIWRVTGDGEAARAFEASEGLIGIQMVDLDGDGEPEAVTADVRVTHEGSEIITDTSQTTVSVLDRQGDAWTARPLLGPGRVTAVADFDEDGTLDIVAVHDNAWKLALGQGDLAFAVKDLTVGPLEPNTSVSHVYPTDMNGDGHVDLVALTRLTAYPQGEDHYAFVLTALGRGDGTFAEGVRTTTRATQFLRVASELADFTGDGVPDLVMQVERSTWLLPGNVDGTFSTRVVSAELENPVGLLLPVADVDDDGRPDLAVPHQQSVSVLLSRGGTTFEVKELPFASGEVDSVTFAAAAGARPQLVVLSNVYVCADD